MAQSARKHEGHKQYTPKQLARAKSIINGSHSEFSAKVLKIYDVHGDLVPFKKNRAQVEFGKVWDECLRRFGYVRIITVKARKRGISTEVAGRFVQGLAQAELKRKMCDSLVLAHDDPSSTSLFGITKKMMLNMGDFTPRLESISRHRLDTKLSSYLCMTAGKQTDDGAGKGRAMTPRQVHISEVAHIHNAQTLASSVISAVPCVAGTAIVMETTANGEGDYFHTQYLAAERGKTDFLPFFAPWFWDDDNQCDVPVGLELSEKDIEYQRIHGLSMRQMAWRRKMEVTQGLNIKHGRLKFKRENPATWQEAFSSSAIDSFLSVDSVRAAMDRPQYRSYGAIVAGYDPSLTLSGDKRGFIYRQGANVWGLEYPVLDGFKAQAAFLKRKLDNKALHIDMLFIAAMGGGYEVWERLDEDGYTDRIRLVNEGKGALEDHKYANKRAEMSDMVRHALIDKDKPLSISVDDEHRSTFMIEMTSEGSTEDYACRRLIEKKEVVKARCGYDPAGYDALKTTFSDKIIRDHVMGGNEQFAIVDEDIF